MRSRSSSPGIDRPGRRGGRRSTPTPPPSSQLPGVARVDAVTGSYVGGGQAAPSTATLSARFVATPTRTWLSVVPSVEPLSADGEKLVHAVRAVPAPFAVQVAGGPSAELVDTKASLFSACRWPPAIIAVITFVLLFLMFGSVVVPLKALVLNVLSLTATFGAMVWIFQEGHLSGAARLHAHGHASTRRRRS